MSTQNQAFNALLFRYEQVLGRPAGDLSGIPRATGPKMVPTVLGQAEMRNLLGAMEGTPRTTALLSTALACASSNARGCGSRTSISTAVCSPFRRRKEDAAA